MKKRTVYLKMWRHMNIDVTLYKDVLQSICKVRYVFLYIEYKSVAEWRQELSGTMFKK